MHIKEVTAARQHDNEIPHSTFTDRLRLGSLRCPAATGTNPGKASVWSTSGPATFVRTQTYGRPLCKLQSYKDPYFSLLD